MSRTNFRDSAQDLRHRVSGLVSLARSRFSIHTLSSSSGTSTDRHSSPSAEMSAAPTFQPASLPRLPTAPAMLPTNIWERIIDVLAYSGAGGSRIPDRPSLSACSMVCKSWQQRARSHLCQIVRVSSRDQLLSFVAFLSSSPHLCTLVQHLTFHGYSHEENILSEDDSWISSAPLLFPALPRLHAVAFINVDFSYQHAIFDKAFGKLKFTSNIKSLAFTHYRDMSMITFSRFTHLAHVLRAEAITFHSCTFSSDVTSSAVTRNSRIAYWTVRVHSWTDISRTPLDQQTLNCFPNLSILQIPLGNDDNSEELESCFTPQHDQLWSRICQVVRYIVSLPKTSTLDPSAVLRRGVAVDLGGHMILIRADENILCLLPHSSYFQTRPLSQLTATTAAIISTWSKILYALRACDFVGVKINLQAFGVVWNWDEHTPETWKAVDDVLAQHYTALRYLTVKLQVPTFTLHGPPHRVLSSHYGCVDDIVYALFPQTLSVKRVMFEKSCFDPSCRKTFETISVPPTSGS